MRDRTNDKNTPLKKAIVFSAVHFVVGMVVAYALTGQLGVALSVALVEPAINAVIIYFHARWEEGRLTFGRGGRGAFHPHGLTHA